ncbi:hypothetical protein O6H91_19G027800 [Diphasiastrum complanatum]|nr:hypothetical protein O6H91_19G027800 [Diphasiastrum complanatum]
MQFLGVVGIIKESFKILVRYVRLLSALALVLVLPLSFAVLAHTLVSNPLIHKIKYNESELNAEEQAGSLDTVRIRNELYSEWIKLGAMVVAYVVFVLAFSLLSTAAVVYSVACIYSGKEPTLVKVMSVVPRVWKRLMCTFLWVYLVMISYHAAFVLSAVIIIVVDTKIGIPVLPFLIALVVIFLGVQVYLNVIWHLASVISVLEESYGLKALKKSVNLVKGKKVVACILVFFYMILTAIVSAIFHSQIVKNHHHSKTISRVFYGSILVLALSLVNLWGILVQSVIYFTCKSYHHESIDRIALSELLDAYSGEYVPLKGPIPMETFEV